MRAPSPPGRGRTSSDAGVRVPSRRPVQRGSAATSSTTTVVPTGTPRCGALGQGLRGGRRDVARRHDDRRRAPDGDHDLGPLHRARDLQRVPAHPLQGADGHRLRLEPGPPGTGVALRTATGLAGHHLRPPVEQVGQADGARGPGRTLLGAHDPGSVPRDIPATSRAQWLGGQPARHGNPRRRRPGAHFGRNPVGADTLHGMPIGTASDDGAARVRRAGWLVTAAALVVAVATLVLVGLVPPSPGRTVAIVVAVVLAFALAGWRALRARRDPTTVAGLRPISSWLAAFGWGVTVFSALVALAAPDSGGRAVIAGILAGCLLVLVGRSSEQVAARR